MYTEIVDGWDKLRNDFYSASLYRRQAYALGATIPMKNRSLDRLLPTYGVIIACSLLDEALDIYIGANCPHFRGRSTLGDRVNFLTSEGAFSDECRVREIKDLRNSYAHERDKFADWKTATSVLDDIEAELQHLGIIPVYDL
jgi:hypothetical protein